VVLLPTHELAPADLVAVLLACTREGRDWVPVLMERSEEGVVGIPFAAGYQYRLEEIARFCRGEGDGYLGIHQILDRVRATRHDINNPLAAALAETQLLLMDESDEDARRALDAVQSQLRRIATLIGSLSFPPPSRPAETHST
jgi:signal transduction histidine kinase